MKKILVLLTTILFASMVFAANTADIAVSGAVNSVNPDIVFDTPTWALPSMSIGVEAPSTDTYITMTLVSPNATVASENITLNVDASAVTSVAGITQFKIASTSAPIFDETFTFGAVASNMTQTFTGAETPGTNYVLNFALASGQTPTAAGSFSGNITFTATYQ